MKRTYTKLANYGFLRKLLGWILIWYYRVKPSGTDCLNIEGPYIVMPNHMGVWDPLIISICVPRSINYITSDNQFRSKALAWLLHQLGCIPKKKAVADMRAIKSMIYIKKQGGVIGIFPEGKRSWNGVTDDILFPTAKLIKTLKIPVVTAVMHGGYLSRPRWAIRSRRGRLSVDFSMALTPEKIQEMSVESIYDHMTNKLAYDEYAWQDTAQIPFKGKKLAEKLELALFMCPHCHTIGLMKSKNNAFMCTHCHYTVTYTDHGYFTHKDAKLLYHKNPRDWHDWQLNAFKQHLIQTQSAHTPFFIDQALTLLTAEHGQASMNKLGVGKASLFNNRIEFVTQDKQYVFNISAIRGMNVQANCKVDFYHDGTLYQFYQAKRKVSALKWKLAIDILQASI